jgi:hypothetical protein
VCIYLVKDPPFAGPHYTNLGAKCFKKKVILFYYSRSTFALSTFTRLCSASDSTEKKWLAFTIRSKQLGLANPKCLG